MATTRLGWTNLILHTSSYINERKNHLQTAHALASILLVIQLIVAEVWLAIISLPLYVVTENVASVDTQNVSQYKVRRVMTLSVLLAIILIWIIKLVIILLITFAYDPRQALQVTETATQGKQATTTTIAIPKAPVDIALPVPKITEVKGTQGSIIIKGESTPNKPVVVILNEASDTDGENPPRLYASQADAAGRFTVSEDENVFYLPVGNYIASAVAYDSAHEVKSQTSNGAKLSVTEHPVRHALGLLDEVLNVLAIAFILVGLGAAILTL